jgi:integrase
MRQKVSEVETMTITVLGKGRNGGKTRTIMLGDTVKEFVARWMYEREFLVERFKKEHPSQTVPDLLFIHEWHGELVGYSESGIDRIVWAFKKRMENAYARAFDFGNHTMRRTFGRRQWMLKTPIETISEMLGHESIDMTKKYLGLDLEDMSTAFDQYAKYQKMVSEDLDLADEGLYQKTVQFSDSQCFEWTEREMPAQ